MAGRLIGIGDVHGCAAALESLLTAIAPQSDDRIVFLGDIIDRGPDSRGVIDQILNLRKSCSMDLVLGNHEEMMLEVIDRRASPGTWLRYGGVDTLDSYGFKGDLAEIPPAHVELLRQAQPYVETARHFFVHANYDPRLPLEAQPARLLRWTALDEHLPGPHKSGKIAVVGHTPDPSGEVFKLAHLIGLDTWCYADFWLTGMDLDSGQYWQFDKTGQPRRRTQS